MEPARNGACGDWRLPDDAFLASFHLPGADRVEVLAAKNPMQREARIHFDEVAHAYTVDGLTVPRSATGLLHKYVRDFDAQAAIEAMKGGAWWEDKQAEFMQDGVLMSDAAIASTWAFRGEVARARGTLLHFHAESYLNGREIEEPHSAEFQQFLLIYDAIIRDKMEVYRTEVNIFHCGLRCAGQPDCLCRDADGRLIIWDWKRSAAIKTDSPQQMQLPLEHLADCNFNKYILQLNLYRYILESEYGLAVSKMYLGVVHPSRLLPQVLEVPRLEAEIAELVEYEIALGNATDARPGPDAVFSLIAHA
jgi:hypothetical protein